MSIQPINQNTQQPAAVNMEFCGFSVPKEIVENILRFTTPRSARNLSQTCKIMRPIADSDITWRIIGTRIGMNIFTAGIPYKEQVKKIYESQITTIKDFFPSALLRHINAESIFELPVVEFNASSGEYPYYIFSETDPSAVRGLVFGERPFISVRYIDSSEENPAVIEETLFQRYVGDKDNWSQYSGGNISHIHHTGGMSDIDFEYLARLIQGKPCGFRGYGAYPNEDIRRTFKNKSIVHLI